MADFFDQVGTAIGSFAPILASAFGGPMAGTAAQYLVKALGLSPDAAKDPKALAEAVQFATPEQQIAIQKADLDFKSHLADLQVDLEKINAGDRDSARQRQVQVKDSTPSVLAYLVTAGFFGLLAFMATHELPANSKDMLNIMVGTLGTAWVAIISYFYGSSMGSAKKDETITALSK